MMMMIGVFLLKCKSVTQVCQHFEDSEDAEVLPCAEFSNNNGAGEKAAGIQC